MEEETVVRYLREYSEIRDFQHASRLEYALLRQKDGLCLRVGQVRVMLKGLQEEYAARLLQFLFENAVTQENLFGVVQDICGTLAEE
ncbi:MAG: hypothetical protein ACI4OI_05655 [Gemmiger sp.]